MMSLAQFSRTIGHMIQRVKPEMDVALARTATLSKTLAAHYPGEYQEGWPALAQSTLERKERGGWPTPSPLLRTGELAGSYDAEVDPTDLSFTVGSHDPVSVFQEIGTMHIPPRPVSALALQHALPFAEEAMQEAAVKILSGR